MDVICFCTGVLHEPPPPSFAFVRFKTFKNSFKIAKILILHGNVEMSGGGGGGGVARKTPVFLNTIGIGGFAIDRSKID